MALALSSEAQVARALRLGANRTPEQIVADDADVASALAVAREWVTGFALPAADLPDPLPESMHRACRIIAVAVFHDRDLAYGASGIGADDPNAAPSPRAQALQLLSRWRRPGAGSA